MKMARSTKLLLLVVFLIGSVTTRCYGNHLGDERESEREMSALPEEDEEEIEAQDDGIIDKPDHDDDEAEPDGEEALEFQEDDDGDEADQERDDDNDEALDDDNDDGDVIDADESTAARDVDEDMGNDDENDSTMESERNREKEQKLETSHSRRSAAKAPPTQTSEAASWSS